MKLNIPKPGHMNLALTMRSEQCPASLFFWQRLPNNCYTRIYRVDRESIQIVLSEDANNLLLEIIESSTHDYNSRIADQVREIIKMQFRLYDDFNQIDRTLNSWPEIARLLELSPGLRLMRDDDFFPRIIDSICSQNTSIKHLNLMMENLTSAFGKHVSISPETKLPVFPSIFELANATEEQLRNCKLGYRAKYMIKTIEMLIESPLDVSSLENGSLEEAELSIRMLPGVGPKVGALILMYGFGRQDIFPVDLWVARALKELYGWTGTLETLQKKAQNRFGNYSGYVSNYLFFIWRTGLNRQLSFPV